MIRRIAASLAALIAASILVAPSAQADETPARSHTYSVVKSDPAPSYARSRWIDWD